MVKVWHPDRFQADAQLRAKAERTLQSINDAYALLQGRTTSAASASATDSGNEPESATARPDVRARTAAGATVAEGRHGFRAISCSRQRSVQRWAWPWRCLRSCDGVEEPAPAPASDAAAAEVPATPAPADVELNAGPRRPAARTPAGTARPESGADLLIARGRGTGQVSARNATAWDAAVLLDGPSGARGFFLRRGEQVTLLDVAPGTYGLRVMFGATWTGRAFAAGSHVLPARGTRERSSANPSRPRRGHPSSCSMAARECGPPPRSGWNNCRAST